MLDRTDPAPFAAPFVSSVMKIEPQWIDYNGHLNVAYYNVLFDRAVDEVYELIGLGPDYLKQHAHSTVVAELHVRYLREVHEADLLRVRCSCSTTMPNASIFSSNCCTRAKTGCRPPRKT